MIRYTIATWDFPTSMKARAFVERFRAPAARDALWQAVYDMIEGAALRDRPIAYQLRAAVEACEVSPPPIGHYRLQTFQLYSDGTGPRVIFRAERTYEPRRPPRTAPALYGMAAALADRVRGFMAWNHTADELANIMRARRNGAGLRLTFRDGSAAFIPAGTAEVRAAG